MFSQDHLISKLDLLMMGRPPKKRFIIFIPFFFEVLSRTRNNKSLNNNASCVTWTLEYSKKKNIHIVSIVGELMNYKDIDTHNVGRRGGGQTVSVLVFYSKDTSSNHV